MRIVARRVDGYAHDVELDGSQNLRVDGGWVPYGNPHGTGFPGEAADD